MATRPATHRPPVAATAAPKNRGSISRAELRIKAAVWAKENRNASRKTKQQQQKASAKTKPSSTSKNETSKVPLSTNQRTWFSRWQYTDDDDDDDDADDDLTDDESCLETYNTGSRQWPSSATTTTQPTSSRKAQERAAAKAKAKAWSEERKAKLNKRDYVVSSPAETRDDGGDSSYYYDATSEELGDNMAKSDDSTIPLQCQSTAPRTLGRRLATCCWTMFVYFAIFVLVASIVLWFCAEDGAIEVQEM